MAKYTWFRKKAFSIILSVFLVLTLMPVGVFADDVYSKAEPTSFTIHIVHTNDIHAHVEDDSRNGNIGVERLKTIIDSYKDGCDLSLVLDSGDLYHGLPIATISEGKSVATLTQALGYDAMTVGNHDWNFGQERLKELIRDSNIKMLAGNVVYEDSGKKFFGNEPGDEFLIKTVEKGGRTLKVGIFGVIDQDVYNMTTPSLLQGLKYSDAVTYANDAAKRLREEGCDVVIALTHATLPADIASKFRGVDLCLAGHEHMLIDRSVSTPDGGSSYLFEDNYFLQDIGCYELNVECSGSEVKCSCTGTRYDYASAQSFDKDPSMTALLQEIKDRQNVILSQNAGYSPEDLDGVWEDLRIGETDLGRAVTSSYLDLTGADVAFENAGGIRASIKQGDLTYGDIINVSPYGNYIVTCKMSGKDLMAVFEANAELEILNNAANDSGEYDAWPDNSGNYLQLGGVLVQYDPSLPEGHRIIFAAVGGKPLNEQASYVVAINSFLAEIEPAFSNAVKLNEYIGCAEDLITYFSKDPAAISEDISTARWVKTNGKIDPEPKLDKTELTLKAGKIASLKVTDGVAKKWESSDKTVATVTQTGKVTALKKGTATIAAVLADGKKLTCRVGVKTSPELKIRKEKIRKHKTYYVKKGKYLTVNISGKAKAVKNAYASTNKTVARVTSEKNTSKVKIKGAKRGRAVVSVTVNGVKYKIKVRVI